METTKDESFGVVPILKKADEWLVLLVEQISYHGSNDRFWTFPKGHPEGEESPKQTAKRELLEETGVTDVRLIDEAVFTIEYTFRHENKHVEKTVTYYLGVCSDDKTTITLPNEIAALEWFTLNDAMQKLTHKNAQEVLLGAGQFITTHESKL